MHSFVSRVSYRLNSEEVHHTILLHNQNHLLTRIDPLRTQTLRFPLAAQIQHHPNLAHDLAPAVDREHLFPLLRRVIIIRFAVSFMSVLLLHLSESPDAESRAPLANELCEEIPEICDRGGVEFR